MLRDEKKTQMDEAYVRRALEKELGHIRVSEELIAKTLQRAETDLAYEAPQERSPVRLPSARRWQRLTAAAASLLVLVLGGAVIGFGLRGAGASGQADATNRTEIMADNALDEEVIFKENAGAGAGVDAGETEQGQDADVNTNEIKVPVANGEDFDSLYAVPDTSEDFADNSIMDGVESAAPEAGDEAVSGEENQIASDTAEPMPTVTPSDGSLSGILGGETGAESGASETEDMVGGITVTDEAALGDWLFGQSQTAQTLILSMTDEAEGKTAEEFLAMLSAGKSEQLEQASFPTEEIKYQLAVFSEDKKSIFVFRITESAYIKAETYMIAADVLVENEPVTLLLEQETADTLLLWLEKLLP